MARRDVSILCGAVFVLFLFGHLSFLRSNSGVTYPASASRGYGIKDLKRRVRGHRAELQKLTSQINEINRSARMGLLGELGAKEPLETGDEPEEEGEAARAIREQREAEYAGDDVFVVEDESQTTSEQRHSQQQEELEKQEEVKQQQQQQQQQQVPHDDRSATEPEKKETEAKEEGNDDYVDHGVDVEEETNTVADNLQHLPQQQQQEQQRPAAEVVAALDEEMTAAERVARSLAAFRRQKWTPLGSHSRQSPRAAHPELPRENITFAHLLNPVNARVGSEMYTTQQMTFATIAVSQLYAQGRVNVEVVTAQYEEDLPVLVPPSFRPIHNLERSSMDVIQQWNATKRLPLLRELMMAAYNHTNATHIIFSNLDIAVMPSFYENMKSLLQCGATAFAINRVEIPGNFTLETMEEMYATVMEYRQKHPGFDCFVIPRKMVLAVAEMVGDVFIGYPPVGQHLRTAIAGANAGRFITYTGFHRTFHLGHKNGQWDNEKKGQFDYQVHNWQAAAASGLRRRGGTKFTLSPARLQALEKCGFRTEFPENPRRVFRAMPIPSNTTTTTNTTTTPKAAGEAATTIAAPAALIGRNVSSASSSSSSASAGAPR